MSEADYAEFMKRLTEVPPAAWRAEDGTIYSRFAPQSMTPGMGLVSTPVAVTPDSSEYERLLDDVLPHFDFQATPETVAEEEPADA